MRATRTMASQWRLEGLTATYAETAGAVLTLSARASAGDLVATQGHVLSVEDLVTTLVVEATIHHLDMVTGFDDDPGPGPDPLKITRSILDGLWGRTTPIEWDSRQWIRASSGRAELTRAPLHRLGADRERLPLLQ